MTVLPGPLVDAAWLRAHLTEPDVVLVDVRWVAGGGPRAACRRYEAGHIPGAVFLGIDDDLAAPPFQGPGRHPLPSPELFAATMSRVGIADDTSVIAYDDAGGSIAARLWWMLDVSGHRVALLDGGLATWGGQLATGPDATTRRRVSFTPRPWPDDVVVDASVVSKARTQEGVRVIDARLGERYRGEAEALDPVAGHIPGAASAPWADALDRESGRFLSPEQLRGRFERLGVGEGGAIAYCGSGVTACHALLAMRLAGLPGGRLYEGSWSDWVHDGRRPVATGDEPGRST